MGGPAGSGPAVTSILAHEFGYAVLADRYDIHVEEITLWMFGGPARLSSSQAPEHRGTESGLSPLPKWRRPSSASR